MPTRAWVCPMQTIRKKRCPFLPSMLYLLTGIIVLVACVALRFTHKPVHEPYPPTTCLSGYFGNLGEFRPRSVPSLVITTRISHDEGLTRPKCIKPEMMVGNVNRSHPVSPLSSGKKRKAERSSSFTHRDRRNTLQCA